MTVTVRELMVRCASVGCISRDGYVEPMLDRSADVNEASRAWMASGWRLTPNGWRCPSCKRCMSMKAKRRIARKPVDQ